MGKHHTSSLRNFLFFLKLQIPLSSFLPANMFSFFLSMPPKLLFIYPSFLFLLSPFSLSVFPFFGTFHHFCCFAPFHTIVAQGVSQSRIFQKKFYTTYHYSRPNCTQIRVYILSGSAGLSGASPRVVLFLSRWVSISYRGCYIVKPWQRLPIFGFIPFSNIYFLSIDPNGQGSSYRLAH